MAKQRFKRSDYSTSIKVAWLSEHHFDYVVGKNIHRENGRYRLKREPSNPHDKNAVAIYVNHLKVGYIPAYQASGVSKSMDSGDVFSVIHERSTFGNYNEKYDNKKGDGYYRELVIIVYNESEIARAKNESIDPELEESLKIPLYDSSLKGSTDSTSTGCGCITLLIGGSIFFSIAFIILA